MTNQTQQASGTETNQIPFGAKLQRARESMELDRKDAAAQLRLHEKYIDMMESDALPEEMPAIFKRGYIRAYGKLLQLSEDTIAEGLAPISAKPKKIDTSINISVKKTTGRPNTKYMTHVITFLVAATLIWLLASWWQNKAQHTTATPSMTEKAVAVSIPEKPATPVVETKPAKSATQSKTTPAATKTSQTTTKTLNKSELKKATQAALTPPTPAKHNQALPSPLGNTKTVAQNNSASVDEDYDDDDYYYVN